MGSPPEERQRRGDLSTLARGSALNAVGAAASGVLGFAVTILITRGLGAQQAGEFFVAAGAFAIAVTIAQSGADTGLVRTISRWQAIDRVSDLRGALLAAGIPVLVLGTVVGAAVFFFAPDLAGVLIREGNSRTTEDYLRLLALFIPVTALVGVLLAGTRGFGTMLPVVLVDRIGQPVVRVAFVAIAIAAGVGSTLFALAWASPYLVQLAIAVVWLWVLLRAAERRARPRVAAGLRVVFREFWAFTTLRAFAAFLQVLVASLDVLLVGALSSAKAAGIYGAVSRVVVAGAFLQRALILALGPQVSALLARHEYRRAGEVYQTSTCWLVLLSFPVFITVAVFAPTVLHIFGSDFAEGRTPLVILALSMLVNMATGPATTILLMAGRSSWNFLNAAVSLALNVGLNVVLIPRYGITGAAAAWSVSIVVQNVAPVVQNWHAFRIHPFGRGSFEAAGLAAACFGLVGLTFRFVGGTSPYVLASSLAVSFACYAWLAWRARRVLALGLLASAVPLPRRSTVAQST